MNHFAFQWIIRASSGLGSDKMANQMVMFHSNFVMSLKTQAKNDYIHWKVQVAHIENKMRKRHLGWFGNVLSRDLKSHGRKELSRKTYNLLKDM
ncbi:hypothetical protein H5410_063276 [Solanum commersonii]|uniref:Uncharacterized protein n=1 Tax=Solanum commersonii TaxID=4109 RepID=A0A9J5WF56_SOLCO|nr:hypothetical protein H5410_063276 [Solanum commersonii]